MDAQKNRVVILLMVLFAMLSLGWMACGGDEPGTTDGDGTDTIASTDAGNGGNEGEGGQCATPCTSDFDCAVGEKCQCPPESPNCRISEMCCYNPNGDAGVGTEDIPCMSDLDCPSGCICEEIPGIDGKICNCEIKEVDGGDTGPITGCADGFPMINVTPDMLDFGNAAIGLPENKSIVIGNDGTCPLTVTEVAFLGGTSEEFACEGCSPNKDIYPKKLEPGESFAVNVTFSPTTTEPQAGKLQIVSTDPDYPTFIVELTSSFKGKAILTTDMADLRFGQVNVGSSKTLSVTLTNSGTGNAALEITKVDVDRIKSDFKFVVTDTLPKTLAPGEFVVVDVTYEPADSDVDEDLLLIEVENADNDNLETDNSGGKYLAIPLSGRSITDPRISVDKTQIDFGEIPADLEVTDTLKITNSGGENLTVSVAFDQLGDPYFHLNPTAVGTIPAGASFLLMVNYKPELNEGDHKTILHLTSNDANTPAVDVEMLGTATNPEHSDSLKVVMTFDNNSQGFSTGDLRYVSLAYISEKYGFCDQVDAKPDWLEEGRPRWSKLGSDSNPQFVFHAAGFDDEKINVGLFDVYVSYDEDCASIPVDILAQILNIGPDILLSYLTSGFLPPGMIDLDLGNMCFDRSSSDVNIQLFINGTIEGERGVTLKKKGEDDMPFIIQRKDGFFTIVY